MAISHFFCKKKQTRRRQTTGMVAWNRSATRAKYCRETILTADGDQLATLVVPVLLTGRSRARFLLKRLYAMPWEKVATPACVFLLWS